MKKWSITVCFNVTKNIKVLNFFFYQFVLIHLYVTNDPHPSGHQSNNVQYFPWSEEEEVDGHYLA